jgi:hypothetical protein
MLMRKDFGFTYSAEGYMIQYKGKNIGGTSILGKYKGRGRAKLEQIQQYRRMAESEIQRMCSSLGSKFMLDNIEKIRAAEQIAI